jgi:cytochrome c-type biogenesis protein CcmH/NrfF
MMWVLWTVPLLVLLLEHLAYMQGVAQGFEIYSTLTAEQRRDVKRILDGQDE